MSKLIALPRLAAEVQKLTGVSSPGGYRRLYMLATDGRLPTELVNGRYFVKAENLPAVAEMLGLRARADLVAA